MRVVQSMDITSGSGKKGRCTGKKKRCTDIKRDAVVRMK